MKKCFILIPAANPTGPVKGAYALANTLASHCEITLVTIKPGVNANTWLDPRVNTICLSKYSMSFLGKVKQYRSLLQKSGGRDCVVSLSLCFSADFVNIFCKDYALTCSSVRGNLFINYRHDYGLSGIGLAFIHLFTLRWIDRVVAMNKSMAKQIYKYSSNIPKVIGNFIDESQLERRMCIANESDPFRFIFVGSFTSRKMPTLLVKALKVLHTMGINAVVDYVGTGSEMKGIEDEIKRLGLVEFVTFHGFLSRPEILVREADVFVLPSLSEGISRAAMEALFLGIPCVLRDVDGTRELLIDGFNGAVFRDERDLPDAMLRAAKLSRRNRNRECLLPKAFRQHVAAVSYLKLMEIGDD